MSYDICVLTGDPPPTREWARRLFGLLSNGAAVNCESIDAMRTTRAIYAAVLLMLTKPMPIEFKHKGYSE
jgi:hypothetical protein